MFQKQLFVIPRDFIASLGLCNELKSLMSRFDRICRSTQNGRHCMRCLQAVARAHGMEIVRGEDCVLWFVLRLPYSNWEIMTVMALRSFTANLDIIVRRLDATAQYPAFYSR